MKLYISYYDNYISIVEGIYNSKKDKFNIKNTAFVCIEDVKVDEIDKYSFLREALRLNKFKSKNVVFSLNTRDVIIKQTHMHKVNPKDLNGIMNIEMSEIMSLDDERYTFSYEVMAEKIIDNKEVLDIVVAAISNEEIDAIMSIFKEFKLNIERIDTMSTSYGRLLKKVEYRDIMMLNIGKYGTSVNIYKEDSLFIHDNAPVRVNENSNYSVALALVDEVRGLMNFYSSRNYGKNVDTIVLVGQSNENEEVVDAFRETFNSDIVVGIEKLFDIEEDIQGDLQTYEISNVCDILGSMLVSNSRKDYNSMNLLPLSAKNRQNKLESVKKCVIVTPLVLGVLASPALIFKTMEMKVEVDTKVAQARLDEITLQHKGIEVIDDKIKAVQDEIGIYDLLSSKDVMWGNLLNIIDKNIPYRADLTNISVYYDESLGENSEEGASEENTTENTQNTESTEVTEGGEAKPETPIYDQIPNIVELEGVALTPKKVGEFVYSLNKTGYFKSVKLKNSIEDKENGGYTFHIVLEVIKDAVAG